MTTSLVMSVTDELIAELEAIRKDASDLTPDSEAQEYLGNLAARLLAERAELKRDAERYRWLRDNWFQIYGESKGSAGIKISIGDIWNHAGRPDHVDAAIDAARSSAT